MLDPSSTHSSHVLARMPDVPMKRLHGKEAADMRKTGLAVLDEHNSSLGCSRWST